VTPFAHIAGIPVEETLLALAPAGMVGVVVAARAWLSRATRVVRRRPPVDAADE
jgi:hypothetical protein